MSNIKSAFKNIDYINLVNKDFFISNNDRQKMSVSIPKSEVPNYVKSGINIENQIESILLNNIWREIFKKASTSSIKYLDFSNCFDKESSFYKKDFSEIFKSTKRCLIPNNVLNVFHHTYDLEFKILENEYDIIRNFNNVDFYLSHDEKCYLINDVDLYVSDIEVTDGEDDDSITEYSVIFKSKINDVSILYFDVFGSLKDEYTIKNRENVLNSI